MRFVRPVLIMLLLPLTAALALLPGCEGTSLTDKPKKALASSEVEEAARVEVVPKAYGTISGKVTFDGKAPEAQPYAYGANAPCCQASSPFQFQNKDETWIVDAQGGVKNAVIILQPPQGKFFKIPENQQKPKEMVKKLEQPFCAFIPRVFVMFPSFFEKDNGTVVEKETGQKLAVINNAGCPHNYSLVPEDDANRGGGGLLAPGKESPLINLHPQEKPITFKCDVHNWMRAYAFVLDHPYAAVTGDDGTFKIENAPLGVPLQVVGWHENAGFFNGGINGKTETLDKQALDFKIKAR